jgi:hypothetical protein
MKTVVALLALFTASALAQSSDLKEINAPAAVGFKRVPIGASGADLVEAFPWIDCPGGGGDQICTLAPSNCHEGSSTYEKCRRSMSYGGVPIKSVDFRLFDGRVALIFVKVEAKDFDRLKETLMAGFGKPTKAGTHATCAEAQNDYYQWTRGGGQVTASRLGGDDGDSSVSILTPATAREAERRRQRDIEAGARDL